MAILYHDLIEGNEATLTVDGWQFNRTAIVDQVVGVNGYQKLLYATQLLNNDGAYIGVQQHPALATAYLRQISLIAIDNDTVKFNLVYKENMPVQITCNTSLSQESTNIAYASPLSGGASPITLTYTYPVDYVDPNTGALSSLAGKEVKQGGTVMRYIPEISFSVTRSEVISGKDLVEKQKAYVGKVNSLAWAWIGSTTTQPIYSWLCTGITGDSQDGGINFNVTYSFAYREDTWNPWIVFTRVDGNPATDVGTKENVTKPEAYKQVYIYRAVSFGPLNI